MYLPQKKPTQICSGYSTRIRWMNFSASVASRKKENPRTQALSADSLPQREIGFSPLTPAQNPSSPSLPKSLILGSAKSKVWTAQKELILGGRESAWLMRPLNAPGQSEHPLPPATPY